MTNTWLPRAKKSKVVQQLSQWQIDTGDTGEGSKWDAILGAFFIVRLLTPWSVGYVGDVFVAVLILVRIRRRSTRTSQIISLYLTFATSLVVYLTLVSISAETDYLNRVLRIITMIFLGLFAANGKINIGSLLTGMFCALVLNIALYYLNLTPANAYVGSLTGVIADKNVSGLFYAALTLLTLLAAKSNSHRVLIISVGALGTFLTLSRASISALAFGLLWILVAKKLNGFGRVAFGICSYFLYTFLEQNFSQAGIFANRVGTDLLRARIDLATSELVSSTPWHGRGLGTAAVDVGPYRFFVHNSFQGLFIEGGYLFEWVVVGGLVLLSLILFKSRYFSTTAVYVQASTIVVLLCATRLGEVFITIPTFLTMGCALAIISRRKCERESLPRQG